MANNKHIPEDACKAISGKKHKCKKPAYFSFDIEVLPLVETGKEQIAAENIIITEHNESGYKDYKPGETENEMVIQFTGKDYVHKIEDEETKVKTVEHTVTKKQGNWYSVSLSLPKIKKYFSGKKFSILIMPKDGQPPIPLFAELNGDDPFDIPEEAKLKVEE